MCTVQDDGEAELSEVLGGPQVVDVLAKCICLSPLIFLRGLRSVKLGDWMSVKCEFFLINNNMLAPDSSLLEAESHGYLVLSTYKPEELY